jgi:hypothetical protein
MIDLKVAASDMADMTDWSLDSRSSEASGVRLHVMTLFSSPALHPIPQEFLPLGLVFHKADSRE